MPRRPPVRFLPSLAVRGRRLSSSSPFLIPKQMSEEKTRIAGWLVPIQRRERDEDRRGSQACVCMPLTSPAFPPGHYRFINREYLVITYRTDPASLEVVVPE